MDALLPEGFFQGILATHVAGAKVDYLPQLPNLPQPRSLGRVKSRSASVDWLALSFDPWSAGRKPLNTEFIPMLTKKQGQLFETGIVHSTRMLEHPDEAAQLPTSTDGILDLVDTAGLAQQHADISKAAKQADDFRMLCSYARHGKIAEIEELIEQPDWNMPIDICDEAGNTLFHIAAQNGNKRIAKLCLRLGADIDRQNLNGHTALHFAFGFGFEALGEYLITKGADNTIRNADGLTCYEGLSLHDLEAL
jgi:ankyrin repeat protein